MLYASAAGPDVVKEYPTGKEYAVKMNSWVSEYAHPVHPRERPLKTRSPRASVLKTRSTRLSGFAQDETLLSMCADKHAFDGGGVHSSTLSHRPRR